MKGMSKVLLCLVLVLCLVPVAAFADAPSGSVVVYSPHDADPLNAGVAQFMAAYPDINVVEEMANMMTAQRGYEANVSSIETVKGMYMKALELGK